MYSIPQTTQQMDAISKKTFLFAIIVDDSLFSRSRSKRVELLARVFDHVTHRYMRGFRLLVVGWSDGNALSIIINSLYDVNYNDFCTIKNSYKPHYINIYSYFCMYFLQFASIIYNSVNT